MESLGPHALVKYKHLTLPGVLMMVQASCPLAEQRRVVGAGVPDILGFGAFRSWLFVSGSSLGLVGGPGYPYPRVRAWGFGCRGTRFRAYIKFTVGSFLSVATSAPIKHGLPSRTGLPTHLVYPELWFLVRRLYIASR